MYANWERRIAARTPAISEQATRAIEAGWTDAIAFGRPWIPNPDFAERVRRGGPYREPDRETFYGGGAEGYSDFEPMDASEKANA